MVVEIVDVEVGQQRRTQCDVLHATLNIALAGRMDLEKVDQRRRCADLEFNVVTDLDEHPSTLSRGHRRHPRPQRVVA